MSFEIIRSTLVIPLLVIQYKRDITQRTLSRGISYSEENLSVKQFLFPVLRGSFKDKGLDNYLDALSEFTAVNADQTAALRFNIKINGKPIVENVIANGVIFATKLGSTGYFKSVARTIFTQGIGVGFIDPTYSVPNLDTSFNVFSVIPVFDIKEVAYFEALNTFCSILTLFQRSLRTIHQMDMLSNQTSNHAKLKYLGDHKYHRRLHFRKSLHPKLLPYSC